jgi:hypothetical protein
MGGNIGGASGGNSRGSMPGRGGFTERPTTASLVIFRFPRDPITPEDKEVQFVTRLCGSGGFGGGGSTGGVAPPSGPGAPQFELSAGAQRASGGDINVSGQRGMGEPLPACNYQIKKTFKLKDMMVKGELQL